MNDSIAALGLSHRRLVWWRKFVWLGMVILLSRLAFWQLWMHADLSRVAEAQYSTTRSIDSPRGMIFDRHGNVIGANQQLFTLFAEPQVLTIAPEELGDRLAPLLANSMVSQDPQSSDEAWLAVQTSQISATVAASLSQTQRKWVPLFHRLTRSESEKIDTLNISGLGTDPRTYRLYPDASVSAHLIGFVGKNERGEDQGYFGVEGYYDLELRGRSGRQVSQTTALGLPILFGGESEQPAQPGRDLTLTIDKALQFRIEQSLLEGMERYGASAGEVIVMDPNNGEILAMASYPNYDPNNFLEFDPRHYRNPVVSELYEPGSTFKIMTVAAGIEEGVITPDTTCPRCAGPRQIGSYSIKTWNEVYNPDVSMRDALAKSDNTAMVFIQEELGKDKFLDWLRRFGLDQKTGIDLQGEEQYSFRANKDWRTIDVATASFGQGIAVTSLNLLRGAAAIANGGYLVQPHVVQSVTDKGAVLPIQTEVPTRVISPETARTVADMMVYTVSQGDAKWAAPTDIEIAGKTGTAQIASEGKYLEDKTIASFVGFAPAYDPKFVMLVKLREPTSSPWGSETAAPLWFNLARLLL